MAQFLAFSPVIFTHSKDNSVSLACYSTVNVSYVERLVLFALAIGHTNREKKNGK